MSYPTLPPDAAVRFVELVREAGGTPGIADILALLGGSQIHVDVYDADLSSVESCATQLDERLRDSTSTDTKHLEQLEGEMCGAIHSALATVPIEVLDDPAFWTYLAVRYFWRFILAREVKSVAKLLGQRPNAENETAEELPLRRYFDGSDVYQIPLRMYVRAQAVREGDDYSLTTAVHSGTDFWRSHVVRVSTSYYPPLSRALARAQSAQPLATTRLRLAAKRINRYRANMHPVLLDDDDQDRVVETFWPAE